MTTTETRGRGRQLRQSLLISINGVTSEPLTWAGAYFGDGSASASLAGLRASGGFLMGRGTYELFSRQWPKATGEYADFLNAMPKYVFSNTLQEATWTNTEVVTGDVVAAVADMKAAAGDDLVFYGHGRFGQSLTDAGLVDQLTLNVVPVFVADGSPMFQPHGLTQRWDLVSVAPGADPGLASLTYRPVATS